MTDPGQHPGEGRETGWEELRREIEALPGIMGTTMLEQHKVLAIVDRLAAARGEPGLDVERLARAAYEDPPPTGRRPVPWTPGLRRYWTDWARRMAVAMAREL